VKLSRRTFMPPGRQAQRCQTLTRTASAQGYPSRSVRLLVGYAAGGPQTPLPRLVGQSLSERLSSTFVIENRPGAGSNIAAEAVAGRIRTATRFSWPRRQMRSTRRSTRTSASTSVAILRPWQLLARSLSSWPYRGRFPAKTVSEFIRLRQRQPGKDQHGVRGAMEPVSHVSGEQFKMLTEYQHEAYSLSRRGHLHSLTFWPSERTSTFSPMSGAISYVRAGDLRALAVTTKDLSEALPDCPSVDETVRGYEVQASGTVWRSPPKNTAQEIVDSLNAMVNAGVG